MHYFDIPTIEAAIERLQNYSANWLLPAFVFASNNVGTDGLVDLSERLGTDHFLDRYFNGRRLGIPPFASGNNLLRPRLKGIQWDRGTFAGDHIIRQDTKMWGNLFSSRGYREMRLSGLIEGEKAITGLTDAFQPRFEAEIPDTFRFEDFLVWLFAFEGLPDEVTDWGAVINYLLMNELGLEEFKPAYRGRFRQSDPPVPWPVLVSLRPSNQDFISRLAPKLAAFLKQGPSEIKEVVAGYAPVLGDDDPLYASICSAIQSGEALSFLLAGPPGTGKTRYARRLASKLTDHDDSRMLLLQFHPAIGYDDFIEGFRPISSDSGSGIKYELAPRLFLKFAKLAEQTPKKKFVIVIDELNRGDVARIFGEVLTYLEPDYRGVKFTLPYSSDVVALPANLLVIATANPYDRSVTDLDDALLRRFCVFELEPDSAILKSHLQEMGVESGVINRTLQMFSVLNRVMVNGFGHTAFLAVRSLDDLASVWLNRVRLGLRRTLFHDRKALEEVVVEIEALLATSSEEEETSSVGSE